MLYSLIAKDINLFLTQSCTTLTQNGEELKTFNTVVLLMVENISVCGNVTIILHVKEIGISL